ncbi:MAG TPA: phosphatase PAP2 family protein [Thermoanaerobaculia bacterium]|nr:phosphatase PAP2 family protein [Thermoanaerobaculia bacterium]
MMLTPQWKVHRRPYFFELFTLANFLLMVAFVWGNRSTVIESLPSARSFGGFLTLQMAGAMVIRSVIALVRRQYAYFRIIRTWGWISDSLRLIVIGSFGFYTYAFVKLLVPVYHPRLFDQELWDLDRMLCFGISPNILVLSLFSYRPALLFIDWCYANIFFASQAVAFGYFLSAPSRRVRIAFTNGNLALWLTGTWLYMLVPSLGPAYRFPDIWLAHSDVLKRTQFWQAALMRNYQNVLRLVAGLKSTREVIIAFGIGAFPSLHVAFQTFAFLWMRRVWRWGEVLFAFFVFIIFIGSMITGWHYLTDGLAGLVMAFACYWGAKRTSRFDRWVHLRNVLK